jgi:phosphoenolpyruvate carboxylase
VRDRLYITRELLYHCLSHPSENLLATLRRGGGYISSQPLMDDLLLLHSSLMSTRDETIANGPVLNAIRQVQTFGSSLMRLDIRQESTRHRDVMNAITQHLDLGSFHSWSEEEKVAFCERELRVRCTVVKRIYCCVRTVFTHMTADTPVVCIHWLFHHAAVDSDVLTYYA